MQGVEEVEGGCIEEELIVSDAGGLILFLKDLVVVDAKLKVGSTIPKISIS